MSIESSAYRLHISVSPQPPRTFRASFLDPFSPLSWSLEPAIAASEDVRHRPLALKNFIRFWPCDHSKRNKSEDIRKTLTSQLLTHDMFECFKMAGMVESNAFSFPELRFFWPRPRIEGLKSVDRGPEVCKSRTSSFQQALEISNDNGNHRLQKLQLLRSCVILVPAELLIRGAAEHKDRRRAI